MSRNVRPPIVRNRLDQENGEENRMEYGRIWPNWTPAGKSQVWNGNAAHGACARGVSTLNSTNLLVRGQMTDEVRLL